MINTMRHIEAAYNSIKAKESEAAKILADVQAREAAIIAREARCTGIESAQVVLAKAEAQRVSNVAELNHIAEERVKFDNWMREERQALAAEATRLAPLQDAERQLATDRAALYAREAALKSEQAAWKPRYIQKIKDHFKNTGGAPSPDDIT